MQLVLPPASLELGQMFLKVDKVFPLTSGGRLPDLRGRGCFTFYWSTSAADGTMSCPMGRSHSPVILCSRMRLVTDVAVVTEKKC